MAIVDSLIFCLKTRREGEKVLHAENIFGILTPDYIPGLFSFSVIVNMRDLEDDNGRNFKVVFTNPKGIDVISMEGEIPILEDTRDYPDEYKGVNVAMDWLNVDFKCSGEYRITVYYNDKEIYTRTIYAKGKNE